MGWLANRRIGKMTDPVEGTLTITGTSPAPTIGVRAQSFTFVGVVQAPGLPSTAVQLTGLAAPAGKWPQPGAALPVVVDRAHPQQVVIQWNRIPTGNDLAWQQAQGAAFQSQTGIDVDVLAQAVTDANATPPDVPRSAPDAQGQAPVEPEPAPVTVRATGTVIAVRDVRLPPDLEPPGGVHDLTIRLDPTGATAVARVRYATKLDRDRIARPGTAVHVLVDPANPGVVTLVTPNTTD